MKAPDVVYLPSIIADNPEIWGVKSEYSNIAYSRVRELTDNECDALTVAAANAQIDLINLGFDMDEDKRDELFNFLMREAIRAWHAKLQGIVQ